MKLSRISSFILFAGSVIILNAASGQIVADSLSVKRIDSLIMQRLPSIAPGCVVLVAKGGKVLYKKAFGIADLKTREPMNTEMLFRLGSMTKQYTAIAILQLVEQGKIHLQDSIQQYVPDFRHKPYPITIENLLTQTSGIINYQAIEKPDSAKVDDTYTPAQGVDYFKDEPLTFKPGSRFEYSNSNYYLLGYIIEKVTGQTYEQYLNKHLLEPAGLTNTYYIHPEKAIPNTAPGYSRFNGKHWENAELQSITMMYAAGGLMANATDIFKWHQVLLQGKLVSLPTLNKAFTAYKFDDGTSSEYGYGWFIKEIDDSKTIEHSGSTDGYQTDELYLPKKDIFIVTLFNGFETNMDWQVTTNDIARLILGKPLGNEVNLTDDSLKRYIGTYTVILKNQLHNDHQLLITYRDHQLFVEDNNPADRLPQVQLYAKSSYEFYIKEAPLRFDFVVDAENNNKFKIVTYNTRGKDADWKKTK